MHRDSLRQAALGSTLFGGALLVSEIVLSRKPLHAIPWLGIAACIVSFFVLILLSDVLFVRFFGKSIDKRLISERPFLSAAVLSVGVIFMQASAGFFVKQLPLGWDLLQGVEGTVIGVALATLIMGFMDRKANKQ